MNATCHPQRRLAARGLCPQCYGWAWRRGDLGAYPLARRTGRPRTADAVAEDAAWVMRTTGASRRQTAERLGIGYDALSRALSRAREYAERDAQAS